MEIPHHSPFSWALCLGKRWVAKRSFQSKVYSNTEFTPRKETSRNQLFKRLRIFHHSKHLQKCNLQKCGGRPHQNWCVTSWKIHSVEEKKRTIFPKFKDLRSLKLTIRPWKSAGPQNQISIPTIHVGQAESHPLPAASSKLPEKTTPGRLVGIPPSVRSNLGKLNFFRMDPQTFQTKPVVNY